jgi:hypothetical protein
MKQLGDKQRGLANCKEIAKQMQASNYFGQGDWSGAVRGACDQYGSADPDEGKSKK